MTYSETMNPTDLSAAPADKETSTVDKLKTLAQEGSQRAKRINQILQAALSETRSEFQAGRNVMTPLAKEVTAEAVSSFNATKQRASEAVNEAWQEGSEQADVSDRIITFLKAIAKTTNQKLFPQVKQQAIRLDEVLENRYGDQYEKLKARFDVIRQWIVVSEPANETADVSQDAESGIVIDIDSQVVR